MNFIIWIYHVDMGLKGYTSMKKKTLSTELLHTKLSDVMSIYTQVYIYNRSIHLNRKRVVPL